MSESSSQLIVNTAAWASWQYGLKIGDKVEVVQVPVDVPLGYRGKVGTICKINKWRLSKEPMFSVVFLSNPALILRFSAAQLKVVTDVK